MAVNIFLDLPNGKMPILGIGTFLARDPAELEAALEVALDAGYRHIDTAFMYQNEAVVGKVLKKALESEKLKREDLFITTKLPPIGNEPGKVEEYMKTSLENLQMEYVDLYLIHTAVGFKKMNGPSDFELLPKADHVGIWKKMEEQVDAGRARNIGLSNFNIRQIEHILEHARIKPANLQVEVHAYFQQKELVDFCHKNKITVVAYGPLGAPGYNQFLTSLGSDPIQLPALFENAVVKKIAAKHSKTSAQVLLRHLIQKGIAVIPKSVTPRRVKENINVFDFALDDDEMQQLGKLDVGDQARIFDMARFEGIKDHPDYPYQK